MSIMNSDIIKSKLENFKNKLDNYINKEDAIIDNLSIINDSINTNLTVSKDAVKLQLDYTNTLQFTKNGRLLINNNYICNELMDNMVNNEFDIIRPKYIKNKDIPFEFDSGELINIGTDIYILLNKQSKYVDGYATYPYMKYIYKYNILDNEYSKIETEIPINANKCKHAYCVSIYTDIYMMIPYNNSGYEYNMYKYDTRANTYTKINSNLLKNWYPVHGMVVVGTDIFIYGDYYSKFRNYKYDTLTDTYTKMKDVPYAIQWTNMVVYGTDIYILGGVNEKRANYKYDTLTDTYTKNADIPYDFYHGSAVIIENDIYLTGGFIYNNTPKYFCLYKYNIDSNSYTKLEDIPYDYKDGVSVAVGNDIYLLGGYYSLNYNYKCILNHPTKCIFRPRYNEVYTSTNSYYSTNWSQGVNIIPIEDDYFTEYCDNEIVRCNYPVDENGNAKLYIKSGAKLNGKKIICESRGWQTINILDYM